MDEPSKTINALGVIEYKLNEKLHRTNGPAVELIDDKEWYINGKKTPY